MSNGDTTDTSDLKRVSVDGETVERFTPEEQQQAKANENADGAAQRVGFGIRVQKIVPPGCG